MMSDGFCELKVAVVGLGYVGLPLAIEFAKLGPVIGFDLNKRRIEELRENLDKTFEVSSTELDRSTELLLSSDERDLRKATCFIIAVPTPIDIHKKPDLNPLIDATTIVGKYLKKNDIVIFESTVYPGATEEVCVPVLKQISNLKYNKDFYVGYSPERINPGDKNHRLIDIKKITSGSTPQIAATIDNLYRKIILAGTHRAPSIKVAEAAKVIENVQRDINIALVNELSIIFKYIKIDTEDVLNAANSKWNFIKFQPGLVGGHCIGVDPYYLTYKAQSVGHYPEIILAGRRLNDNMSSYVASQLVKEMIKKNMSINKSNVLIMGLAYKENCNDIRNTQVFELYKELIEYGCLVDIYDPLVTADEAKREYKIDLINNPKNNEYDSILLAVAHNIFMELGLKQIRKYGRKNHIVYDLKYMFDKNETDLRL